MFWVIKVGGRLLEHPKALHKLFRVTASMVKQGLKPVLVHGGGVQVEQQLQQAGFTSSKHNGLRVSPVEQMPIISGVLAGHVNKQLVVQANLAGNSAVGVCLSDGNTARASLMERALGAVGKVVPGEADLLLRLSEFGFLPIVSSIANCDEQLVNVNADDAAALVAQLLNAELVFLSDVPGVLDLQGKVIAEIDKHSFQHLFSSGVIQGGMAVKVQAALDTAAHLRRSIAVTGWQEPELLMALTQGHSVGTRIQP